ncbi:hypothetical protein GBN24_05845 [Plesiomonas shigelloides]|uniref:hypothetical protein n=1 Tax=Plesiomonas shigelloides TaxID=703 RepID=UPI001262837D|nr:hypothetical protein [Plesiomonas shigelloides]KAB7692640.1 hypothetical protein GBN24_05845 [Plesiomonas shigelloides]
MANVRQLVEQWMANTGVEYNSRSDAPYINTENAKYVSAVAVFLGVDTSSANAKGVDIFLVPENLPTAIATIMARAQSAADYHPAKQSPEVLAEKFPAYVVSLDKVPFFSLTMNDNVKLSISAKDYASLANQIVSSFGVVGQIDKKSLTIKVIEIAEKVLSQGAAENSGGLLIISSIDYTSPLEPKLYIYHALMNKQHAQLAKPSPLCLDVVVNRMEFAVLPELIRTYANTLSRLEKVSVKEWIYDSSSVGDQKLSYA